MEQKYLETGILISASVYCADWFLCNRFTGGNMITLKWNSTKGIHVCELATHTHFKVRTKPFNINGRGKFWTACCDWSLVNCKWEGQNAVIGQLKLPQQWQDKACAKCKCFVNRWNPSSHVFQGTQVLKIFEEMVVDLILVHCLAIEQWGTVKRSVGDKHLAVYCASPFSNHACS